MRPDGFNLPVPCHRQGNRGRYLLGTTETVLMALTPFRCTLVGVIPLAAACNLLTPIAFVGEHMLIGEGFECCVHILDASEPKVGRRQTLGGPGPRHLAIQDNTVWHADFWAPAIIRSDLKGKLLSWGGHPFDVGGLAFDGQQLWALDAARHQICRIERVEQALKAH